MRRAARVDENHSEIAKAYEACGATVVDTSRLGEGFPDLCVGYRGHTFLVEIKNSAQPPNKRKLTGPQQRFHFWWRGSKIHVVDTIASALAVLKLATPKSR